MQYNINTKSKTGFRLREGCILGKKNVKMKNAKMKDGNTKNIKTWGIIAVFAIAAVFFLIYDYIGGNNALTLNNSGPVPANGENLVIAKSEIMQKAKFFSYKVDGTIMELLAFKASDGSIRTAFNTCQICYDSGRGYYVQERDVLICQNCGNRYPADRVGIEKGDCNPIPIMFADRTEDEKTITIPGELIVQHKNFFTKWKRS